MGPHSCSQSMQLSPLDHNLVAGELGLVAVGAWQPATRCSRRTAEPMAALPACVPGAEHIRPTVRAELCPSLFQAVTAQRLLERGAEKARLLDFSIQMRDRLGVIVFQLPSAFRAYLALIGVVPTAIRAFHRKLELSLLVATLTPRAASSAIRHLLLLPRGAKGSRCASHASNRSSY